MMTGPIAFGLVSRTVYYVPIHYVFIRCAAETGFSKARRGK